MLDILGSIINRLYVAYKHGWVNVDGVFINGDLFVVMNPQCDGGHETLDYERETQDNKTAQSSAILKLDPQTTSPTKATDIETQTLPGRFGVYIRFEDLKWWEEAPDFMDVMRTIRVVSIARRCLSIPSIEGGTGRKIKIKCEGKAMTICRGPPESANLCFKNVRSTGKLEARCQIGAAAEWSLRRIRPNEVTDLALNSCNAVMFYDTEFAECVWLLVQHHPRRGDEAYILVRSKELTDD